MEIDDWKLESLEAALDWELKEDEEIDDSEDELACPAEVSDEDWDEDSADEDEETASDEDELDEPASSAGRLDDSEASELELSEDKLGD